MVLDPFMDKAFVCFYFWEGLLCRPCAGVFCLVILISVALLLYPVALELGVLTDGWFDVVESEFLRLLEAFGPVVAARFVGVAKFCV